MTATNHGSAIPPASPAQEATPELPIGNVFAPAETHVPAWVDQPTSPAKSLAAQEATPPRPNALTEAEVHLGELADGPKGGRPDYMGFLSLADAVALRDELSRLRLRVAVLSSGAAPTPEATGAPEPLHDMTDDQADAIVAEVERAITANRQIGPRGVTLLRTALRYIEKRVGPREAYAIADATFQLRRANTTLEDEATALRTAVAGFTQHDVDVLMSLVPVVEHYDRHGDGNRDPVLLSLAERITALLSLRATVAALTADRDAMWQEREGWKTTAAQRGFEVLALRHRLGLPPHDPPQSD